MAQLPLMSSDHEEEQPIDLSSKVPSKETKPPRQRALPPLIPIHEIRRQYVGGILPKRIPPEEFILQKPEPEVIRKRKHMRQLKSSTLENGDISPKSQEVFGSTSEIENDSENEPELVKEWKYLGYCDQFLEQYPIGKISQEENSIINFSNKGETTIPAPLISPESFSPGCSFDSSNSGNDERNRKTFRPLTGKHVRMGTGASAQTLLTLRKKIQQRQQKEV